MGIPGHLTCLLRNLYAGQETAVKMRHGKQIGSKLGKEYFKAVYCHPAYLTSMQSTPFLICNQSVVPCPDLTVAS